MKKNISSKIGNYLLGSLITLTISACVGSGTSSPTPNPDFGQWEWIKGESTMNVGPVYGELFTESAGNTPGSVMYASGVRDSQGNLWLYGGYINDGTTSALWKYNSAKNMWAHFDGGRSTLVNYGENGVASESNTPGRRLLQAMWIDSSSNIYIFGGQNSNDPTYNGGDYNDLWKYNTKIHLWTWIGGARGTNESGVYLNLGQAYPATQAYPAPRQQAQTWTDKSGNLWLFSGSNNNYTVSDLWKYSPTQNTWTWEKGGEPSTDAVAPNGGSVPGVESSSYTPGSRYGATTWVDESGSLWLYGGYGYDRGLAADLWRYNITTNAWTWVGGSSTRDFISPVYGTIYQPSESNTPGSRMSTTSWVDQSGNLWLYGGATGGNGNLYNDLWKYDANSNYWTWMGGLKLKNQPANYTYFGIANPNITPGARGNAIAWTDKSGNFMLFGGTTSANYNGNPGDTGLTDIWKLNTNQYQ